MPASDLDYGLRSIYEQYSLISGFILGALLPILKWNDIVAGFQADQNMWAQLHMDAEDLLRMAGDPSSRDDLLTQLDRQIRWARLAAARSTLLLPKDERLLADCEREVRERYRNASANPASDAPPPLNG